MRVESIRAGYGDLRQVGISHLCPSSSKNGVPGDRSLESTPREYLPLRNLAVACSSESEQRWTFQGKTSCSRARQSQNAGDETGTTQLHGI
jgi:hypothetical protein